MARNRRGRSQARQTLLRYDDLIVPLPIGKLHDLLEGKHAPNALDRIVREKPDISPDGKGTVKVRFEGSCFHRSSLTGALLHYCEFQMKVESHQFYVVENKFVLFKETLASAPLDNWNTVLSERKDETRDEENFTACIVDWIKLFAVNDSRRKQLQYIERMPYMGIESEFDGIDDFCETFVKLVELSNMIPSKGKDTLKKPKIKEKEMMKLIFESQDEDLQEEWRKSGQPEPDQVNLEYLKDWFRQREASPVPPQASQARL